MAKSADAGIEQSSIHQAVEGSWPVLPAERNWGLVGIFGVTLSAGIAAWSYSIGGAVAWYLPAGLGTLAMIAGALVGMYFVTLAAMPVSVKYGIDTIASSKPQYGSRGSGFNTHPVRFDHRLELHSSHPSWPSYSQRASRRRPLP